MMEDQQHDTTEDTRPLNADVIADKVKRAGVFAYVEQTGGGCATLYAGPSHEEIGYGPRYTMVLGPGQYGWGEQPSTFTLTELYLGPDDEGATDATDLYNAGVTSEQDAADLVIAYVKAGRILGFDDMEALGFDAQGFGRKRRRP